MSIQIKRQGNLNATSCSSSPLKPNSLAYGELALDSKGYLYAGNGKGEVVSLIRAADRAAVASTSDLSITSATASTSYFSFQSADFQATPFLYSAFFYLSKWSGTTNFTQTATIVPLDNGPDVESSSKLSSEIMCEQTNNANTNEILSDTLDILNKGFFSLGNNKITITTWEKPTSDINAIFLIKKNLQGMNF